MEDFETQPSDGLVIVVLRVRDSERRDQIVDRFVDIGANHVTRNVFELSIADWDDGLWDEEVDWFTDLLELTRDSLIVWKFTSNAVARFVIGDGGS